jgi:hypothetical protein
MRLRLVAGALALTILVLTGCAAHAAGRANLTGEVAGSGPSRTLGAPSDAPPRTAPANTDDEQTTSGSTTTVSATSTSSASTTSRSTVTNSETTTEYATVYPPTESTLSGPASVIGPPDMGPNQSGYVQFQSPSGNIMCAVFDGGDLAEARCDIAQWAYPQPPQTQDCGSSSFEGGVAEIGADGLGSVGACVSDTVADPASPVLDYGKNAGIGRFGCHSAENGVTCANLANGHGFRISRGTYEVF